MAASYQQLNTVVAEQPTHEGASPVQQQIMHACQPTDSDVTPTDGPTQKQKKALRRLGIAECVIGGLSVMLAVAVNSVVFTAEANTKRTMLYHGHAKLEITTTTAASAGIWSGIWLIITGIRGILAINRPTRCMRNSRVTITTAIITACGTAVSMTATILSISSDESQSMLIPIALHSTITLLCLTAMLLTIVRAGNFSYNRNSRKMNSVSTGQVIVYPQQQYVQGPNGQLLMIVNQPIMPQAITQVPNFQQVTPMAPFIVNNIPYPSGQQRDGAHGFVHGEGPPAYYQGTCLYPSN